MSLPFCAVNKSCFCQVISEWIYRNEICLIFIALETNRAKKTTYYKKKFSQSLYCNERNRSHRTEDDGEKSSGYILMDVALLDEKSFFFCVFLLFCSSKVGWTPFIRNMWVFYSTPQRTHELNVFWKIDFCTLFIFHSTPFISPNKDKFPHGIQFDTYLLTLTVYFFYPALTILLIPFSVAQM